MRSPLPRLAPRLPRLLATLTASAALPPGTALAHATEGGFVLLLPTDLYIAGGVGSVAVTVLLMALIPDGWLVRLLRPRGLWRPAPLSGKSRLRALSRTLLRLLACALFLGAVAEGWLGQQDPTRNLMPLYLWTGVWLFLVPLQSLAGDLWAGLSPFRAPLDLLQRIGWRAPLRWPARWGQGAAVLSFLGFAMVLLAHPAPADPDRLARMALLYWVVNLAALALFGPRWLIRGEGLTVLMRAYARLAPLRRAGRGLRLGLPGWRIAAGPVPGAAAALFLVVVLGIGSFDGVNETFWWLARIGVNPLEFSGRSAIVGVSMVGALGYCVALALCYALAVEGGLRLSLPEVDLSARRGPALRAFAPALLPIAWAYHVAHYLVAGLIDGQALLLRLTAPFRDGPGHVTTGFLSNRDGVEAIFLTQAGVIVLGHGLAILLSHRIALRLFGPGRAALAGHLPLAVFMVFYTLLGLWLLAAPRGA
ncbi:hypothetical protein [Pseudooceanicola aestuarii]|uniref:hypothetical protein n=1 Tax=Pseudooceanicola aestuarii TaxID=2697319 RepID=UPI0013D32AB1|nr:hypothetical protein [Pseudooceanicola aestuarii]